MEQEQVILKDGVQLEHGGSKGYLLLEFEDNATGWAVITSAKCTGEMMEIAKRQIEKLLDEAYEKAMKKTRGKR